MGFISKTAIVSNNAEIGNNVTIRDFAIIEDDVIIGNNCTIDYGVLIKSGARLANNCTIYKGAVIACDPSDYTYRNEYTLCEIKENTVVKEYATVSKGTRKAGITKIGSGCYIMAYTHVGHDDIIGNNVTLINCVELAGHVTIEDWVYISTFVGVHQFVKIGCHSLISYVTKVSQDVPPYIIADGNPLTYRGLNTIGLRRRGFSNSSINSIKSAYKLIFESKYNISDALKAVKDTLEITEEIKHIINFIETSERGIVRKRT
jgi:UDP-N-acetylglucosamine acyltransferase